MNRQIRADTKGPAAVGGAIALVHPPIIPAGCNAPPRAGRSPARYNRRVHFVYIVRCADGTLYTGYARDPFAREQAHNNGRGAEYTAGRRPVRLVYQEAFRSVRKALARE